MSEKKTVTLTCDCGEPMTVELTTKALGGRGYVLSSPMAASHECRPSLPTEPGIYRDKDGEIAELNDAAYQRPWCVGGGWCSAKDAAAYAPFTRVRTLADDEVAVKIDGGVPSRWLGETYSDAADVMWRYLARIARAAKEAGLLDEGTDS